MNQINTGFPLELKHQNSYILAKVYAYILSLPSPKQTQAPIQVISNTRAESTAENIGVETERSISQQDTSEATPHACKSIIASWSGVVSDSIARGGENGYPG